MQIKKGNSFKSIHKIYYFKNGNFCRMYLWGCSLSTIRPDMKCKCWRLICSFGRNDFNWDHLVSAWVKLLLFSLFGGLFTRLKYTPSTHLSSLPYPARILYHPLPLTLTLTLTLTPQAFVYFVHVHTYWTRYLGLCSPHSSPLGHTSIFWKIAYICWADNLLFSDWPFPSDTN